MSVHGTVPVSATSVCVRRGVGFCGAAVPGGCELSFVGAKDKLGSSGRATNRS